MAALEPRDELADQLREPARALVDEPVLLVVREIERLYALGNSSIEELNPGADETLHGAAVEPRQPRELVLLAEVQLRDHERQDLRVLRTDAVVGVRRQAELCAQPPQDVGRAAQLRGQPLVRDGDRVGFRQVEAGGKRELSVGHAAGDVLERDAGVRKGGHEANDMDVDGGKQLVVTRREKAELEKAVHVLARAGGELGELVRGDPGHLSTLDAGSENVARGREAL